MINKRFLIFIIYSICFLPLNANASRSLDWMNMGLSELANYFSKCIEPPTLQGINNNQTSMQLNQSGEWRPSGIYVQGGKSLNMKWNNSGIIKSPAKYLVIYRIDPRFKKPQTFIQRYDYDLETYISDFHTFKSGDLLNYVTYPETDFAGRRSSFVEYFNFQGRDRIKVKPGDVVNISLADDSKFFRNNAAFQFEYNASSVSEPEMIYTTVPMGDNKIIYTDASNWCNNLSIDPAKCINGKYENTSVPRSMLNGHIREPKFNSYESSLNSCSEGQTGAVSALCYYDEGRGLNISLAGNVIKNTYDKFTKSNINLKSFAHFRSTVNGDLDFNTSIPINGMLSGVNQFFDDWNYADYDDFRYYLTNLPNPYKMNFLHFGRYIMEVEVGPGEGGLSTSDISEVKVFYYLQSSSGGPAPTSAMTGELLPNNFNGNASDSGYLWFKVVRPGSEVGGNIPININNYTGETIFSDVIYKDIIVPLRAKFNELTKFIFTKLSTDASLKNIARGALTLYLMFYTISFLIGSVKIKVTDLIERVIKIAIVITMFNPRSWEFFNNYLFNAFVGGNDFLFKAVGGFTSNTENVFGFIDPLLNKFLDSNYWFLLFIQLLQIHNGLTFVAIMTIYSSLIYLKAILEVIISYVLAFVGMAVMISLAPLFIICILFEKTRSIFDNWISTLFNYAIQPSILLIFFLMIDQLISILLDNIVARACWGDLIPLHISVDLKHLDIPISFDFGLDFLPSIPFFIPQLDNIESLKDVFLPIKSYLNIAIASLLFYAYALMSKNLVAYVNSITQTLTSVQQADRKDGKAHGSKSNVAGVFEDIKNFASPITKRLQSADQYARNTLSRGVNGGLAEGVKRDDKMDYSALKNKDGSSQSSSSSSSALQKDKQGETKASLNPLANEKGSKEGVNEKGSREGVNEKGGSDPQSKLKSDGSKANEDRVNTKGSPQQSASPKANTDKLSGDSLSQDSSSSSGASEGIGKDDETERLNTLAALDDNGSNISADPDNTLPEGDTEAQESTNIEQESEYEKAQKEIQSEEAEQVEEAKNNEISENDNNNHDYNAEGESEKSDVDNEELDTRKGKLDDSLNREDSNEELEQEGPSEEHGPPDPSEEHGQSDSSNDSEQSDEPKQEETKDDDKKEWGKPSESNKSTNEGDSKEVPKTNRKGGGAIENNE